MKPRASASRGFSVSPPSSRHRDRRRLGQATLSSFLFIGACVGSFVLPAVASAHRLIASRVRRMWGRMSVWWGNSHSMMVMIG
jgi:hypothetical protein